MMVRVSVVDAEAATSLVQQLVEEADATSVDFDVDRQEVRVELGKDPDRALVGILSLLEHWLRSVGHPPTSVAIDDHRYVLGPAPST